MFTMLAGSAISCPASAFVATVDAIGPNLEPFYGTRVPWGGMVFVRLRPPEMSEHSAMSGMRGM